MSGHVVSGRAARLAWALVGVTALAAAAQVALRVPHLPALADRYDVLTTFPIITVGTLAAAVVGALVVGRQPRNPVGWLFCVTNCLAEVGLAALAYAQDAGISGRPRPLVHEAAWLEAMTSGLAAMAALVFLLLLFPTGRLPSRRWRPLLLLAAVNTVALEVVVGLIAGAPSRAVPLSDPPVHGGLLVAAVTVQLVLFATLLTAVASLAVRWRRASGVERQQLRLVAAAAVLFAASLVPLGFADELARLGLPRIVPETAFYLAYTSLPVAAGLAVLRYGLYGVEVLIDRAVVLAGIVAASTIGYVAVVVLLGAVLGDRIGSGVVVSLGATAVVAVCVQPARRRVHALAGRLAYGERAAPYDVLATFSRRLGDTLSVDEVLPRMASAAAQGVGARAAAVQLVLDDGSAHVCRWPDPDGADAYDLTVPVVHAGCEVGKISVSLPSGHRLDRAAARLVADLAGQAGVALHDVRLTVELSGRLQELSRQGAELGHSRRRLLAAQTVERQRLEARISTSVRPHLAALRAGLDRAELLLDEPERAAAVVVGLSREATAALDALREIARGVFPPLLVDRGLPAALAALTRSAAVPVAVAAEGLPRSPLPVEATAYFCCSRVVAEADQAVRVALQRDGTDLRLDLRTGPVSAELAAALRDRVAGTGGTLTVGPDGLEVVLPTGVADGAVPAQSSPSSTPGPNSAFGTKPMAPDSVATGPKSSTS